jgi:2-polyprenyl-3-methyl-5-hydroxy-6-metoxy-1,4-benzoquinol methylase
LAHRLGRKDLQAFAAIEKSVEESSLQNASFDTITLFNVLDRLPDPYRTLQAVYDILKPSGMLVVDTRNIEGVDTRFITKLHSIVLQPRAHLVSFLKRTLHRALTKRRFILIWMRYYFRF